MYFDLQFQAGSTSTVRQSGCQSCGVSRPVPYAGANLSTALLRFDQASKHQSTQSKSLTQSQDRRIGSPVGSPIAYQDRKPPVVWTKRKALSWMWQHLPVVIGFQDMDLPQTPQFRDRLNTQDGDEFPQEAGMLSHVKPGFAWFCLKATEWSTTTTPYPCNLAGDCHASASSIQCSILPTKERIVLHALLVQAILTCGFQQHGCI